MSKSGARNNFSQSFIAPMWTWVSHSQPSPWTIPAHTQNKQPAVCFSVWSVPLSGTFSAQPVKGIIAQQNQAPRRLSSWWARKRHSLINFLLHQSISNHIFWLPRQWGCWHTGSLDSKRSSCFKIFAHAWTCSWAYTKTGSLEWGAARRTAFGDAGRWPTLSEPLPVGSTILWAL